MLRFAVLVSGGGTNLEAVFQKMEQGQITGGQICVVISNHANAYALERAKRRNVDAVCISPKMYQSRDEFHEALLNELKSRNIDYVILAGYLLQISQSLVEYFPNRIINIHPSLIPSFCGKGFYGIHVHEKVLERGVKITGATVHFVDCGMDTGPIIMQKAAVVQEDDTPETLQKRVMEECEWVILPDAIKKLCQDKIRIVDHHVIVEE